MTLRVKVDHPHFDKGEIFSVGGLAVPNGESVEVGPETEQTFIDANGVSIEHYFSGDNPDSIVSVSGTAEVKWEPPTPVESVEEEAPTTNPINAALASEGGEE